MSGGGILQIVAVGQQDIYLTSTPMITFFKAIYRRHTNFAMEAIEQTFNGTPDFGQKATVTISRNGDLAFRMYLQVELPALSMTTGTVAWCRELGHVILQELEVTIGGQRIDKHYTEWLSIWNQLTQSASKEDIYNVMIGNTKDMILTKSTIAASTLYIPLQFWFNRNPGLALPLIALQYHEVKINISFRDAASCYITSTGAVPTSGTPHFVNCSLWVDYIYLDTEERKNFAQASHEYLFEQLQYGGAESYGQSNIKSRLSFNHPTKEIVWALRLTDNLLANGWTDFTDNGTGTNPYAGADPCSTGLLQLNGNDRFTVRPGSYFNLVQPYQHHTRGPAVGVYVYSFALKPEEHQPSGSLNFSRIDNATLQLGVTTGSASLQLFIFAVNYNILRVMSGMGGSHALLPLKAYFKDMLVKCYSLLF